MKITINPKVLEWARKEAGYTIDEIADRLSVDTHEYHGWETKGKDLPLGQLKDIAKSYKRQLAMFFLPVIPPTLKKPNDFRNLNLSKKGLSKDILLAIRRSKKYIQLAEEILGQDYFINHYNWLNEIKLDNKGESQIFRDDILLWMRNKLNISIQEQKSFKYVSQAYKEWRNSIEANLGIFVFQFPLPMDEIQGFCYSDKPPYVIVLNSKHSYTGRMFTMMHELAHILKKQSAICFPDDVGSDQVVELECNEFAGKLLVPDNQVVPVSDLNDLRYHANKFKVSKEVMLRRNFERKYLSRSKFFDLLEELRQLPIPPKRKGFVEPIIKSKSSRGEMFYNIVVESAHNNVIDFNTASDALGLKIIHIT